MTFNFDVVSRLLKVDRKNGDNIFPLPGNVKNTFIIVTKKINTQNQREYQSVTLPPHYITMLTVLKNCNV